MNMADAFAEARQPIQYRLPVTRARAIKIMARVEDQPYQPRIGQVEQPVDLIRCLDIAGAVVVEHYRQPSLIAPPPRHLLRPRREGSPVGGAEAHLRRNPPRVSR